MRANYRSSFRPLAVMLERVSLVRSTNGNGTSTQLTKRNPYYWQRAHYSKSLVLHHSSSSEKETGTSSSYYYGKSFDSTPLGRNGRHLLDGLHVYSVPAKGDGHPLAVYGIESQTPQPPNDDRVPVLLLHGRTWSSVPVYHLLGGQRQKGEESRSLMESLFDHGLMPYCMDFRGFGGTAKDDSGTVEPLRCVEDVESVLDWIAQRHGNRSTTLLGWSQGALVAQLVAQQNANRLSKLILYGSIYDPLHRYPREPLYQQPNQRPTEIANTFDDAVEDFTIQGTIAPEPARHFAHAALVSDPIKASWKYMYQFNNCDPARVHTPTLVIAGDQDPYAPLHVQQELFNNLARGSDRTYSILADCDHAVHLLEGRHRLTGIVVSFIKNGKQIEQGYHHDRPSTDDNNS